MKNTKLLALTLVVAIMLTGAGYALWSDTLYVDSTVNTGYLDVDFIKVTKILPGFYGASLDHEIVADSDGYNYGDHEAFDLQNPMSNRDKVKFTLTNFYPGAVLSSKVTVKNTGTVPVKIDAAKLIPKFYEAPNALNMNLSEVEEDDIEITVEPVEEANSMGLNGFTIYKYLDVGKELDFIVTFTFKSNSGNETENKTYNYIMELPFEQGTIF